MATEPIQAGPYPVPTDAPDGPNQFKAVVDWAAPRLVMRFTTTTTRDAALPTPTEGMEATTGTGATLVKWQYVSGAWLDVTVRPAWLAYTPTWTNLTVGNGTLVARSSQVGKDVQVAVILTFGSTTSISGAVYVSVPVTPATGYPTQGLLGTVGLFDTSGGLWRVGGGFRSGSNVRLIGADGVNLSATAPWTWATGDIISVNLAYEAV